MREAPSADPLALSGTIDGNAIDVTAAKRRTSFSIAAVIGVMSMALDSQNSTSPGTCHISSGEAVNMSSYSSSAIGVMRTFPSASISSLSWGRFLIAR